MNLFSVANKLAPSDQPPITFDTERCVRVKQKNATCELCVQRCPVNALRLNGRIIFDDTACVACGACLHICPLGAFNGDDDTTDLTNCITRLNAQAVELVCALHPAPDKGANANASVIRTNTCLAALSASAFIRLLSQVSSITVRIDACAECSIGRAQSSIIQTFDAVNKLLPERIIPIADKPGADAPVRTVYDAKTPPVSRRDFFRALTGESIRTAASVLASEAASTTTETNLPRERSRLINALKRVSPNDQNVPTPFAGAVRLHVDDQCTACGVCARVCPTKALNFTKTGNDEYRLICVVEKCTDCGMCLSVCKPSALSRAGVPTLAEFIAAEPIMLKAGALKKCSKCNAMFAANIEGDLCPICDFRRRNPFASALPRAARES